MFGPGSLVFRFSAFAFVVLPWAKRAIPSEWTVVLARAKTHAIGPKIGTQFSRCCSDWHAGSRSIPTCQNEPTNNFKWRFVSGPGFPASSSIDYVYCNPTASQTSIRMWLFVQLIWHRLVEQEKRNFQTEELSFGVWQSSVHIEKFIKMAPLACQPDQVRKQAA